MKTVPAIFFAVSLCLLLAVTAAAERVALVIGNGSYESAPLPNPPNDAALVAASLARIGFKVFQKTDLDREALRMAVREFSDALKAGDVALFFYAGHGAQVKGANYLIPVDAPLGMKEFEVEDRNVPASLILGALEESGSMLNIVILDCCRNNPFARGWRTISAGLAEMKAPRETLIAYATSPGAAASDGEGANSPYSLALAQELLRPGLKLEELFKNVARRVHETTKGTQRPWISLDVLGDFTFAEAVDKSNPLDQLPDRLPDDLPGYAQSQHTQTTATLPPNSMPPILPAPNNTPAIDIAATGFAASPPPISRQEYHTIERIFTGSSYASNNLASKRGLLKRAQAKLKSAGLYSGIVDGEIGPQTQEAIRAWQRTKSMNADGYLDDPTLSSLGITEALEQNGRRRPDGYERLRPKGNSDDGFRDRARMLDNL